MERQIELLGGIGASVLGLTGVVVEAQALSSPLNPTVALLLGTNHPGAWDALQIAQHALLPMAIVLLIPALGAYLHVVHEHIAGQAMLISSSAVILLVAGLAVFLPAYTAILFVPAPLVVLPVFMATAASVCALSRSTLPAFLTVGLARLVQQRGAVPPHTDPGAHPGD